MENSLKSHRKTRWPPETRSSSGDETANVLYYTKNTN